MSTMTRPRRAADYDGHRLTVSTDDGVPLAVRTFGSDDAPLTVVFAHGHCLRTESWSFLREHLLRQWGEATRMVFYDHRGHGESGAGDHATYTIEQLGRDLDTVLRTVAPRGPVVLVGHSMGAMVVLAYSRLFPEAIGTRVVGVGLISGAANGLTEVGLGRLLNRHAVNSLHFAVRRAPRLLQASKSLSRRILEPILREANFGTRKVNPRLVALATAMLNETSLLTMAGFLASLMAFDETAVLHRLGAIPALVLAGTADIMVPFTHSVVLASQLSSSELVRLEGAGHSVILERSEEVAASVAGLVERAFTAARGHSRDYAVAG
ncbi:alpha/beta hydrolase [Nocardia cyriacigeorgica]|uniref:Alpha/beta hydrolase n=2 Tax=Nocardia cyriacigeorgica TaxID=135487 RepID=A0A6P1CZK1_9NOCA|nr:alpha/beta hydrolase [Nocardia cyriacigeorgica]NEW38451.1 alpha/beta hydrolase [Nocardia cyriacigeorgica]NEW43585.1 alpha/beta hydrolase [Nocardia cyriacigeorgica]NEW49479.1 alpha/beta hydrolase [Nocardia cyriacigeorgica]NEW54117.1 alpha/beta hydrolase [Nocardia cyriacigeorgica]